MTTYKLRCGRYDNVNSDYPDYNTSLSPSGSFSTSSALANNLKKQSILDLVVSWSFNDGVIVYDDTNSTLDTFTVSTIPIGGNVIINGYYMFITMKDNTKKLGMNSTLELLTTWDMVSGKNPIVMAERNPTNFTSW